MCLTQENEQSVLISAQIQQQSLSFLQRHGGIGSDSDSDSEDDDEADELFVDNVANMGRELFISRRLVHETGDTIAATSFVKVQEGSPTESYLPSLESNETWDIERPPSSPNSSDWNSIRDASSNCGTINTELFDDQSRYQVKSSGLSRPHIEGTSVSSPLTENYSPSKNPMVSSSSASSSNERDSSFMMDEQEDWELLAGDLDQDVKEPVLVIHGDLKCTQVDGDIHQVECPLKNMREALNAQLASQVYCMRVSHYTQLDLQKWDAKMGLRRCHCKTMMDTSASRKALLGASNIHVKDFEPPPNLMGPRKSHNKRQSSASHSNELKKRKH